MCLLVVQIHPYAKASWLSLNGFVRADMRDLKSLKKQAYEGLKRLEQKLKKHWKKL